MNTRVKIGLLVASIVAIIVLAVHLHKAGDKSGKQNGARLQIGKTETHSSISSTSSSSSSDTSTFSSRHVLLFCDNPHPLAREIILRLQQKLEECTLIKQLNLSRQPLFFTNAGSAPDLFLIVNLAKLKQSGIISTTMKTVVTASLGNSPWQSSYHTMDASTAPRMSFDWRASVKTETTFTGLSTDRYAAAARSIADDLAKSIATQIETLADKYPITPLLPAIFFGPYQPATDLDSLEDVSARQVASYCGLFTHNETFWRFNAATNPVPQLERMLRQLERSGWKFSNDQLTNTFDYRVAGHHGNASLEIFRQRDAGMSRPSAEASPNQFTFIVHYREPFTRAEQEAALETLFSTKPNVEMLLPFSRSFNRDQRRRFYELVETSPFSPPNACLQLAEHYQYLKRTNDAVRLLLRTKALAATLKDATTLESRISALAKKISPKQKLKLDVTPEICREQGFLELTNSATIEQTRQFGQPLVFYGPGTHDGVKIRSLTINAPRKNSYPWLWVETEDGMRSSSQSSFSPNNNGAWQHSIALDNHRFMNITAMPEPDKSRVKLTVRFGE